MNQIKVKVFLHDEIPKFGCGWRYLTAKIGRKWVHLEDAMGRHARILLTRYVAMGLPTGEENETQA